MVGSGVKIYGVILIITVILLMVGLAIGCGESRDGIEGRVFDKDDKSVAVAIIRAEKGGHPGALLRTDEDGYYSVNNVFTGRWKVEFFDVSGWQVGLESVTVRADETARLDFTIGAKPPPERPIRIYIAEGK